MPFGSARAWKTYLACSLVFTALFMAVYPTCNWLASRSESTRELFFSFELAIPFIPGFIWVYASLIVLWPLQAVMLTSEDMWRLTGRLAAGIFLAGICFVLFPSRLGFPRTLPQDPWLAILFGYLFRWDRVHNLVPSLHVLNSSLVLLAFLDRTERLWLRILWIVWLSLIAASTLLVHQHHLLDVAAGLGLAILLHRLVLRSPASVPIPGKAQ